MLPAPWLRRLPSDYELAPFLVKLAEHHENKKPRQRFLVAPFIFHAVHSIEAQADTRRVFPVLDQPASEVRAHFKTAARRSRKLAASLRKAPQPHVVLGTRSSKFVPFFLASPPIIRSSKKSQTTVTLDRLLDEAAAALDQLMKRTVRSTANRNLGRKAVESKQKALRARLVNILVEKFRSELCHPYHSDVAKIATIVSCVETNSDFVKKTDRRKTPKHD